MIRIKTAAPAMEYTIKLGGTFLISFIAFWATSRG